jgi:hypothetical protein
LLLALSWWGVFFSTESLDQKYVFQPPTGFSFPVKSRAATFCYPTFNRKTEADIGLIRYRKGLI